MKLHCLQHVPFETPGSIARWATQRNDTLTYTHLYKNVDFPNPENVDFLFILGGPMGIYDHEIYPWILREKRFIEKVMSLNRIVVGICLGAQFIADVLGAKVQRNPVKEIGWYPVEYTEQALEQCLFQNIPQKMNVFHWHSDTFDLPYEAINIAKSDACHNQGFLYRDRILAFQFHLEVAFDEITRLTQCCKDELVKDKYVQDIETIISLSKREHISIARKTLFSILTSLRQTYLSS